MPLHLANSVRAEKRKMSEWRRQRKRDTSAGRARRSLVRPLMLISYLHLLRGPFLKAVTFLMLKQQTAFRPLDLHPPSPSLHLFSSVSLTCRKPAYRIRAINTSKTSSGTDAFSSRLTAHPFLNYYFFNVYWPQASFGSYKKILLLQTQDLTHCISSFCYCAPGSSGDPGSVLLLLFHFCSKTAFFPPTSAGMGLKPGDLLVILPTVIFMGLH